MESTLRNETRNSHVEGKVMSSDQFEQVVTAILEGKYSWACVLILRFAGYNPAHYIPYRTYKRLIKGNRQDPAPATENQTTSRIRRSNRSLSHSSLSST
jgi:hypothetical protein